MSPIELRLQDADIGWSWITVGTPSSLWVVLDAEAIMAFRTPPTSKDGYEPIPEASPSRKLSISDGFVVPRKRLLLLSSCLVACSILLWRYNSPISPSPPSYPHETIPTLLSLVDPKSGQLLYARDNQIYNRFDMSKLVFPWWTVDGLIPIKVHSSMMENERGGDLVSAWDLSAAMENSRFRKSDHMILACGENPDMLRQQQTPVVEVATVEQLEATTKGSWQLPIPRAIRYRFCRWYLTRGKTLIAQSKSLSMPHKTQPINVHLAYTETPSVMIVRFASVLPGTPVVQLGEKRLVKGTTNTYSAEDLCQAPANVTGPGQFQNPGFLHTVLLTDLELNQKYSYKVGLETGQGVTWRPVTSFQSALAAGDPTPQTYLVYGDQGCPEAGWSVGSSWMEALVEMQADVRSIHHVGDLSYANGAATQWDSWLEMIEPATSKWPLMVAVGNQYV